MNRFFKVVLPQLSFLNIKSFIIQLSMFVLSYTLLSFLPFLSSVLELVIQKSHLFYLFYFKSLFSTGDWVIHGVVTPKPLYHPDPYSGTGKAANKLLTSQDGSHTSDFIASYSLYQNTLNPSMLGQFTR